MTHPKDWTGNSKTTYVTLGATNHSEGERAERDLYTTSQVDFVRFLKALKRDKFQIRSTVYEPACGLMHLVEVLERLNYTVIASDIEDRSEHALCKKTKAKMQKLDFLNDVTGVDMLSWDVKTIITNPPYSASEDFVRTAHKLLRPGEHLIMLLRIQFLESIKRYELFKEWPYRFVYPYVKRARVAKNGDPQMEAQASALCFAWFIWEKSWSGEPTIRFIE